jgi:hypothetical protein
MQLPPAVIIHGLPHARLALRPGRAVTLLSAPGAPSYAGCAWWRALIAAARAEYPVMDPPDILDCADAPGRALEALSLGCGVIVLAEPPPALDLGDRRSAWRLQAWLHPA